MKNEKGPFLFTFSQAIKHIYLIFKKLNETKQNTFSHLLSDIFHDIFRVKYKFSPRALSSITLRTFNNS